VKSFSFEDRVRQIDERVRTEVRDDVRRNTGPGDKAEWARGTASALLILHRDDAPPRLELMLHTGVATTRLEPLEIAFYDPDVVNMVAEPVIALLSGNLESLGSS